VGTNSPFIPMLCPRWTKLSLPNLSLSMGTNLAISLEFNFVPQMTSTAFRAGLLPAGVRVSAETHNPDVKVNNPEEKVSASGHPDTC
jgi:hypothetical protein